MSATTGTRSGTLFKPVNAGIAALMVILILIGLAIALLNELNQFAALLLVGGADYLTAFTAAQLQALAALFLQIYQHGFLVAHIFFGLWRRNGSVARRTKESIDSPRTNLSLPQHFFQRFKGNFS